MIDRIVEDETKRFMAAIAKGLDSVLNGQADPLKLGFVLLVFPFDGPPGARTNYVSNADRDDVTKALQEIVARRTGENDNDK